MISKILSIKDCGNTRCNPYAGCKGHIVKFEYSNVTDVGYVEIDGEYAFGGGDELMLAVADVIKKGIGNE